MKQCNWNKGTNRCIGLLLLFILLLLTGCGKKEDDSPFSEEEFTYVVPKEGTVEQIAVNESGILSVLLAERTAPEEGGRLTGERRLICYAVDGTVLSDRSFSIGRSSVSALAMEGENCYFIQPELSLELNRPVPVLYRMEAGQDMPERTMELTEYRDITQLLCLKERLYLIGRPWEYEEKQVYPHPDAQGYQYSGVTICSFSLEHPTDWEQVSSEFPISMAATQDGTLIIYEYSEENGYQMSEYVPGQTTVKKLAVKKHANRLNFVMGRGRDYLYVSGETLRLANLTNEEEVEIAEHLTNVERVGLVGALGGVFYYNEDCGAVVRYPAKAMGNQKKVIRLITVQDDANDVFGCGYRIENKAYEPDAFALKVLAQDKDFDCFLLDSRSTISANLRENGAFYSLNEVEGVKEYLDACFPSLKEAATTADGEIWMLPISVEVPGLLYDKEECKKAGCALSELSFTEFYQILEQWQSEEPEKVSVSDAMLVESYFLQYLMSWNSFDTERFREDSRLMQEQWQRRTLNLDLDNQLLRNRRPEFYCLLELNPRTWLKYGALFSESASENNPVGVTAIPKLTKESKSPAFCFFLAVNPKSDRLKDVLSFISTYTKYRLKNNDTLLFSDASYYANTAFMKELLALYQNAEVVFAMDQSIYLESFSSFLSKELSLEEMVTEIERRRRMYFGE